ncbi:MAG TPA: hypothetical protein DDZ88_01445 [Verrucomicrobiales bacterium]|nr:hypothetical protein [Verrucomicrobiales bacterium]
MLHGQRGKFWTCHISMIPEGSKKVARGKAAKQTPPLEYFKANVLPMSHAGGMREAFVNST